MKQAQPKEKQHLLSKVSEINLHSYQHCTYSKQIEMEECNVLDILELFPQVLTDSGLTKVTGRQHISGRRKIALKQPNQNLQM